MKRRLVAALACRNQGTRLYGKPLQNLDIEKRVSVLEYMIAWIRTMPVIDDIVLGISEGSDNTSFVEFAKQKKLPYIIGDEEDVLIRLIRCGEKGQASDIFRLTTESPFTYFEGIESAWADHVNGNYDFTCLDNVSDGCGFEIIKINALEYSHLHGKKRHRSEFCSLYIRENKNKFKIKYVDVPQSIRRTDLRLTIDYPEDLIVCRAVYSRFKDQAPKIHVADIIEYLDENPQLKSLVAPFVGEGLRTMYL
ncbi:MAG: acylneuraminate cytidylyltransferase [Thermodesulfobacteriota bacterium]